MDNKMNYGSIVDLEPIAYVDAYIFIPMHKVKILEDVK